MIVLTLIFNRQPVMESHTWVGFTILMQGCVSGEWFNFHCIYQFGTFEEKEKKYCSLTSCACLDMFRLVESLQSKRLISVIPMHYVSNCLCFALRSCHQAPIYFFDLLTFFIFSLPPGSSALMQTPRLWVFRILAFCTKFCGHRSFSCQAPIIWNPHPVSEKDSVA